MEHLPCLNHYKRKYVYTMDIRDILHAFYYNFKAKLSQI